MNNLFNPSSNVMATPLGQLVGNYIYLFKLILLDFNKNNKNLYLDKSTDPLIPESNIELFYEICDLINQKEEK